MPGAEDDAGWDQADAAAADDAKTVPSMTRKWVENTYGGAMPLTGPPYD